MLHAFLLNNPFIPSLLCSDPYRLRDITLTLTSLLPCLCDFSSGDIVDFCAYPLSTYTEALHV